MPKNRTKSIIEHLKGGGKEDRMHWCKVTRYVLTLAAVIGAMAPSLLGGQRYRAFLPDESSMVEAPVRKPPVFTFSRQGLLIADHDRFSSIKVHGYMQTDGRLFVTNLQDQAHQTLIFRRVRPLVEGSLAHRIEFRFMPDFGEGNMVVQEAYAEWAPAAYPAFRIGKFKSPIGLEVLRSDRELTFPERSLASDFVPIRDLGVQIGGTFRQGVVEYEAGAFAGTEDGSNAKFEWDGMNETAARMFVIPFRLSNNEWIKQFGIGMAGSLGNNHAVLPTFRTIGQQTYFRYAPNVATAGAHERLAPQAYYFHGSLGLIGEYIRSDEAAELFGKRREMLNQGWQVAGSYVLTGEKNSYDGVRPSSGFDPFHPLRRAGGWEVAIRHSEAHMDKAAFPLYADPAKSAQSARETVTGLTWYINRSVKLMSHFANTSFQMAGGHKQLVSERVTMTRLQFAF